MRTGKQHQEIIHEALATFHHGWMLDDINAAFAHLKRDDGAWREERAAWDGAQRTASRVSSAGPSAPVRPPRGEVWMVDLSPTRGREQAGMRPALVLAVDKFNHGPADLVIVVPLTNRAPHPDPRAGAGR